MSFKALYKLPRFRKHQNNKFVMLLDCCSLLLIPRGLYFALLKMRAGGIHSYHCPVRVMIYPVNTVYCNTWKLLRLLIRWMEGI